MGPILIWGGGGMEWGAASYGPWAIFSEETAMLNLALLPPYLLLFKPMNAETSFSVNIAFSGSWTAF
jgi:hypothetical protein